MEDLRTFKKMAITLSKNQQKEREEMLKLKDFNHISQKLPPNPQSLPPTKLVNLSSATNSVASRWTRSQVIYSANAAIQARAPALKAWLESAEAQKPAYFSKFNIRLEIPRFSADEYRLYLQDLDSSWSLEQTEHLFEQLEIFEGNFLVVADRWDRQRFVERSIEDLIERALAVCRVLAETKGHREGLVFRSLEYDKASEIFRKQRTEKFLARSEHAHKQEERLLAEIKSLELVIKKKEKESREFQKLMELTKEEKSEFVSVNNQSDLNFADKSLPAQTPFAYTRGGLMRGPVPNLPPLTNKKLDLALAQLEIPENLFATEANVKLLEELKVGLVRLFSLNYLHSQKMEELNAVKEGLGAFGENGIEKAENTRSIEKPGLLLAKRVKEE